MRTENNKTKSLQKQCNIFHVNTGSCNGCDIEVLDAITIWSAENVEVKFVEPQNAHVAIITGPMTVKAFKFVLEAIKKMPMRLIIAVGACAVGGGIWRSSYSTLGGFHEALKLLNEQGIKIDKVVYVPGCPVRPESVIRGFKILFNEERPSIKYQSFEA
jgi:Ni,Fe-hydrogenase III small subunit